jgi:hypothetical protein
VAKPHVTASAHPGNNAVMVPTIAIPGTKDVLELAPTTDGLGYTASVPSWLKLVHTSAAAGDGFESSAEVVGQGSAAVMICRLASVHLLAASAANTIVTPPDAPGPVRRAWRHCQVRAELANASGSSCKGTTQSRWPPGARNTQASSQRDTGSAPSPVRRATSAARSSVSMSRW